MREMPTLFSPGADASEAYCACRDHGSKEDVKLRFERAFALHGHLCPEGPAQFASEMRRDFYARAWELYLMAILHDAGLRIEPPGSHGPDIVIRLPSTRRCWIEAVVPKAGTGEDKVFEPPVGNWAGSHGPIDKLLLRYRSVLKDKLEKVERYIDAGIIAPEDAVVIAVSNWGIRDAWTWDRTGTSIELPALAKAVYPVGEPQLVVPIDSPEPERVEVPPRWTVQKAGGTSIGTDFFLDARASRIAAVMYARDDTWNASWDATRALGVIHNVGATQPLQRRALPVRIEWWVEDGQLRRA